LETYSFGWIIKATHSLLWHLFYSYLFYQLKGMSFVQALSWYWTLYIYILRNLL